MNELASYIKALPKAELHIHIEGSLEPEMMFELARRNNVSLAFNSVSEIRDAYNFNCLQDFLDVYYQGMSVLLTAEDFHDLTWAYLQRCADDNVVHTEIFFDPQGHTDRGVSFSTVMSGISAALDRGHSELGITSRVIMCFLRHLDEASALATLEEAEPWLHRITGVGLDSSELGHPPSGFERVFDRAGELGLKRVAHAGEEGPPEYVIEALDLLHVDRVDHGNRAMEDPDLVRRLAEGNMPLTVCPLSNLRLAVVKDLREHPLRTMLQDGLCATVNSDDPAYFGGYINQNFLDIADALSLSRDEIRQLVINSFEASFLSDTERQQHLHAVQALN